jgi:hypothetical protein
MMCCLYPICFGFHSILGGFLVWSVRLCCRRVPWRTEVNFLGRYVTNPELCATLLLGTTTCGAELSLLGTATRGASDLLLLLAKATCCLAAGKGQRRQSLGRKDVLERVILSVWKRSSLPPGCLAPADKIAGLGTVRWWAASSTWGTRCWASRTRRGGDTLAFSPG